MVRRRAISRFVSFSRAGFSSAPVADWKRRLKSSRRLSASRRASSSSLNALRSGALVKEARLPLYELRLDRQLGAGEAKRLLGQRLGNARQLEHDAPRLHDGHPVLGGALSGAHPRLCRLLRHRLVGEEVDPDLPPALDLASHRDARSLDLAVGHPTPFHRLYPQVAQLHGRLALGEAGSAATLVLAVLGLLGQQHQLAGPFGLSPGSSTVLGSSAASGASTTAAG